MFHLLEYTGQLSYDRTGTNLSGQLSISQTGSEQSVLTGTMTFQVAATNALNVSEGQLFRSPDVSIQTFASYIDLTTTGHFGDLVIDLDNTVYSGLLFLSDGEPATAAEDYRPWVLVIRDTHDTNTNGIPDLTDTEQSAPPSGPTLSIARDANASKLSIAGTAGATYDLEQSMTLPAQSWEKIGSITLTNSVGFFDPGQSAGATRFFRLRVAQ